MGRSLFLCYLLVGDDATERDTKGNGHFLNYLLIVDYFDKYSK